jgi:magnesium transporter
MAQYDLLAIPVVDDHNRMVGIVTHDDVIDVVVEEATEDAHRMGAVGPIAENYLEADFVTIWRKRAFWLACLFGAELFTFTALSYYDEAINKVVVLALFVPLCISTGGNSGSQAATLITRALALGQVKLADWLRVLKHELMMGLVLGLTLGLIGFVRGSLTPEDVRGNITRHDEEFQVRVPIHLLDKVHKVGDNRREFPKGSEQISTLDENVQIIPARGEEIVEDPEPARDGSKIYRIPARSETRTEAVIWWRLACVIAGAVAAICVWGTLVGSMLPLFFRRIGVDPGIASSPFVATFVDVTGIVIYFNIARFFIPQLG